MQESTNQLNPAAQKERRKNAIKGALGSSFFLALSGTIILAVRWYYQLDGFIGVLLLCWGLMELLMIAVVALILKQRIKEIEGGEEDVAAQY